MAINRLRYRQLDFIGARILQARELNWLQEMDQNLNVTDDETVVSGVLETIYRQGATFNVGLSTSGLNVNIVPSNISLPMYVFVRDRWEIFPGANDDCTDTSHGTRAGNTGVTLTSVQTVIYLNWELRIRTGGLIGDDPILTDSLTNEATANAGELILHVNTVDTSGVALGVNQLATNTSPIPLFTLINTGTSLIYTGADNIQAQALAKTWTSGLVRTTTPNPIVVSTDDPRMGIAFGGSVYDSLVRTPVAAGGTNSNATPIYKLPTDGGTDIGGISAAKIILLSTTQRLEDGWNWLVNSFNSLLSAFNSHYLAPLGQVNTHPIPTAAQVGAAPISHVGLPLGLATSHPPVTNQNSGGFRVNQSATGAALDPAYGVFTSGTNIGSINHDGDVFAAPANTFVAAPGGAGVTVTGALGLVSTIAGVLSQHVNQVSHANPHGLTAGDIGALTSGSFTTSFLGNGYIVLPTSGHSLILQWCAGPSVACKTNSPPPYSVTWPIAFPTVCLWAGVSSEIAIAGGSGDAYGNNYDAFYQTIGAPTRTGTQVQLQQVNTALSANNISAFLFAVGY